MQEITIYKTYLYILMSPYAQVMTVVKLTVPESPTATLGVPVTQRTILRSVQTVTWAGWAQPVMMYVYMAAPTRTTASVYVTQRVTMVLGVI